MSSSSNNRNDPKEIKKLLIQRMNDAINNARNDFIREINSASSFNDLMEFMNKDHSINFNLAPPSLLNELKASSVSSVTNTRLVAPSINIFTSSQSLPISVKFSSENAKRYLQTLETMINAEPKLKKGKPKLLTRDEQKEFCNAVAYLLANKENIINNTRLSQSLQLLINLLDQKIHITPFAEAKKEVTDAGYELINFYNNNPKFRETP